MKIDAITKKWIFNKADQRAARDGMRFNEKRGEYVCNWIEDNCCLYQGSEYAGKPFKFMPYQREATMRLFGWVQWSDEYNDWIRRFTTGGVWAPKKNGKSPWVAAIELYVVCGDGEQGQNGYTGAKNGEQGRIAQRHAFEMVQQSPLLFADCDLHKSMLSIYHRPTKSSMTILTGDDSRGAKAKEGLNGSVFVDEVHVVDREMMERVGRAGISRKEPLFFSVSTAGDDPSSYGYERYKYGQQVNSGERDDPSFLHIEYSAPEGLRESDIEERLEELGKMANPAWGHIVKPTEFRADWNRSKGNPREVARFKQYRLNLWVGSTNAWLDVAGWEKGQRQFTLEDLRGRSCYIGLDLSRTRDMTACTLLFPWPEDSLAIDRTGEATEEADGAADAPEDPESLPELIEAIRLWPMFWLPMKTAKIRQNLFPFATWRDSGDLVLTPGDVVDYQIVEDGVVEAVEKHELRVLGLFFDQHYAEEITQRIAERLGMGSEERVAVPQSIMGLSPLAKEFERRVSVGLIQHPGNAVMTWQVGHVEVYTDRNQNIRPVKPSPHSGKSIDGVVAALDAMAGPSLAPKPSVYERRGLLGLESDEPVILSVGGDDDDDDDDSF